MYIESRSLSTKGLEALRHLLSYITSSDYRYMDSCHLAQPSMLSPTSSFLLLAEELSLLIVFQYPEYRPLCHRCAIYSSCIVEFHSAFLDFFYRHTIKPSTCQLDQFQLREYINVV